MSVLDGIKPPPKKKKREGASTGEWGAPWPKGVSGNPSGRAKTPKELVEACRAATPKALHVLHEIIDRWLAGDRTVDAMVAAKASQALMDRGYGTAPKVVHLTASEAEPEALAGGLNYDRLSLAQKLQLEALMLLAARPEAPRAIEAQVVNAVAEPVAEVQSAAAETIAEVQEPAEVQKDPDES